MKVAFQNLLPLVRLDHGLEYDGTCAGGLEKTLMDAKEKRETTQITKDIKSQLTLVKQFICVVDDVVYEENTVFFSTDLFKYVELKTVVEGGWRGGGGVNGRGGERDMNCNSLGGLQGNVTCLSFGTMMGQILVVGMNAGRVPDGGNDDYLLITKYLHGTIDKVRVVKDGASFVCCSSRKRR